MEPKYHNYLGQGNGVDRLVAQHTGYNANASSSWRSIDSEWYSRQWYSRRNYRIWRTESTSGFLPDRILFTGQKKCVAVKQVNAAVLHGCVVGVRFGVVECDQIGEVSVDSKTCVGSRAAAGNRRKNCTRIGLCKRFGDGHGIGLEGEDHLGICGASAA